MTRNRFVCEMLAPVFGNDSFIRKIGDNTFSIMIEYEQTMMNPYVAASRGYVDDVIIPSQTRATLIRAFRALEGTQQEAPKKKHGNIPL